MADAGSLERMGRELKCPICLSLLTSAVSITCNHIFCNGCLVESMKSASACPVCKVPFRRREMRPAPHMDNLVAVFKSMEAAAGTSVVSTQVSPSPKCADGSECGNNGSKPKRSQKKKGASKKGMDTTKAPAPSASTKPSISTNKRIHVTPFPESETPIRPKKMPKPEEPKHTLNSSTEEDKVLASDEPGSPALPPFFWLREEDQEGGTAETLSQPQSLDTPLRHNAPTFSDIKDSDDEIPHDMTPNSKAKVTEFLDSEIFEWSQRPCSPELHSTPLKKQVKSKNILDEIAEKDDEDLHFGVAHDKLDHASNAAQPIVVEENKQKRKKARATKNKKSIATNHGKLCTEGSEAKQQCTRNPINVAAKSCQKNNSTGDKNTLSRRNKASSNSNSVLCSSDKSKKRSAPQEDGLEVEAPENKLSERSRKKNSRKKQNGRKLEFAGESTVKAADECDQSKRIRRMSDVVMAEKIRALSETKNETVHSLIKCCTQQKTLGGRSKESMDSNTGGNTETFLAGRRQSNEAISTVPSGKNVSIKNNSAVLKKNDDKVSKVACAFCHSDNITEVSGEMVHYYNGKQVSADFNGGSVIHSHKSCLEWAPNVYFEDDSVFNITTELARSKRIKCACCGIKGAALGCFEMSCRRSFHFTCAKLIPECRWDNENFVVLCPLHQSSKLPIETSMGKKQPNRRPTLKRPSQVRLGEDCSYNWKWPSGCPQKWVLCCSALSSAEKGIVSEFAKVAGVPISTSWNPSVTHVIASTDPSGACKRTFKYLMAILNGKWIVSIDWVKSCMECKEPVDELKFEVSTDVHGTSDGPRLGRQRATNKQPKLFDGICFYLHGDYTKSYRGYLQDLVVAAGGTVLQRKPVSRDQQKLLHDSSPILIVYSVENQDKEKSKSKDNITTDLRQADAKALASASGGKVVSSAWITDSIAACNLQPL
ncbi:hypothetical protein ACP4OV_028666 [Aristida adscensionis]